MKRITSLSFILCFIQSTFGQIINFPDPNFKNALINTNCANLESYDGNNGFNLISPDTNNDGEIDVSEAEAVFILRIPYANIFSLEGIEFFSNLEFLECSSNFLTELDISQNINLKVLRCYDNNISFMDITQNTVLEFLDLASNYISNIDVSNNLALKWVGLEENNIQMIDLTNNENLLFLNLSDNLLTDLNVSENNELINLIANSNYLQSINLNNNFLLEYLEINQNLISQVDLSQNINLKKLHIGQLSLDDLDISQHVNLVDLNCSSNNLSSLDISNNILLQKLNCSNNQLTLLEIDQNSLLTTLNMSNNQIENIDLSSNPNLATLIAKNNELSQIDVSNLFELYNFSFSNNNISEIDLSNNQDLGVLNCNDNMLAELSIENNESLWSLNCSNNNIINLDFSSNISLGNLYCQGNDLQFINIKNGSSLTSFNFFNNPDLVHICADDFETATVWELINDYDYYNTSINSYCTFDIGGIYYILEGNNKVDANTNGCDVGDNFYPSIKLELTDGTNNGTYLADTSGSYSVPVSEGVHTILPVLENTDYFTVSPNVVTVTFPDDGNVYIQDFCLIPDGVHNDVEVIIVPTSQAVPGFDSYYKIIYRNKGNTTLSGSISFDFEDDFMDLLSAIPTEDINAIGNLQWNYTDLQPFETREIEVVFNLNTPTDPTFPLDSDDVLSLNASINPVNSDETPEDNEFVLDQTVVNSYDPNDVTCLEGVAILPEHVGEYLHYRIRFENLGTANATNVVVKDVIDTTKFDVSSLIPLHASHNYTTRIREGNIVEFIFEGINLPFDDVNNDGYVVFKIKTLDSLQLGDTFTNQAEIYFDFNFPVITNIYSTSVQENLSINDFELNDVVLFPNPVNNQLYIKSKLKIDTIKIFDINGRLIQNKTMNDLNVQNEVSVSALKSGVYFMEVYSNGQKDVLKFVKE